MQWSEATERGIMPQTQVFKAAKQLVVIMGSSRVQS